MAPSYQQTMDTFMSSTLEERRPDIINQIWTTTPLMAWVSSKRTAQPGGKRVFINLEYGKNTSIKRNLGRGGKIDLVQDEIITDCWYEWQTYGGGIIRYRDDDLENSGKWAVFNQAKAYEDNLINAFKETYEEDLFGDESVGTNSINGLGGLIEEVDESAAEARVAGAQSGGSNTVGNLLRTTYPWFSNWGRNMTGKDPSTWLQFYMREQFNNVQEWTGMNPEVMITHYNVRDLYEDEVGETLRTMTVQLGDVGIRTVEYKGVPFITSPYAPQDKMWFIGDNTMDFVYDPRMWFKSTDWKEPTQQAFDYAKQIVAKGQFIIRKPRGTSVLYNINA